MVNLKERIEKALADLGYGDKWWPADLPRDLAAKLAADFGAKATCDHCKAEVGHFYCEECRAMIAECRIEF